MPRLNSKGDICGGIGGGYAHAAGRTIAEPAGGTAWVTDTVVAYATGHDHDSPWWVETQDLDTGRRARVPNPAAPNSPTQQEANWIEAGGGLAAFGRPEFVWTSDGRTFPGAGLLAVGPDGSVVLRPQYHGKSDIRIVRRDGTTITIPAGPAYDVHMPTPDVLVWRDQRDLRIKVWGLPEPKLAPGRHYTPRAVRMPNGAWWLLYQTVEPGRERLLLHPWDSLDGYILSETHGTAATYRPDAVARDSSTVTVVWATNEGETLSSIRQTLVDLRKPRVDLSKPAAQPTPPPPPVETLPVQDAIDPKTIAWLHGDVSHWAITSDLTEVRLPAPGQSGIDFRHTKAGKWPAAVVDGTTVEANPWVIAKIGGKWYAATCEWMRPGQTFKPVLNRENLGDHTKVSPLSSWDPQPGEQVGFLVSGLVRNGARNIAERTQIVLVTWPGSADAQPPAPAPSVCQCAFTECKCRFDLAPVLERLERLEQLIRAERPFSGAGIFGTGINGTIKRLE